MDLTIRKIYENEIGALGSFYDEIVYYLETHINYPKWIYGDYPSIHSVRECFKNSTQYIVMKQGEIVGAFILDEDPAHDYLNGKWSVQLKSGEYLSIHALAVSLRHQKQGIGKEIVRFCIDFAKNNGYKSVRLDVVPGNEPAAKLYEGLGFRYVETTDLGRRFENIPFFSTYELIL